MSTNDQDTKQAPAPFKVGDKVRCVRIEDYHRKHGIKKDTVYAIERFGWHGGIVLSGVNVGIFDVDFFVPAVPFVDASGKRWLVVDERVPDVDKDTWASSTDLVWLPGEFTKQWPDSTFSSTRRILAEWSEFPAPAANSQVPLDGSEQITIPSGKIISMPESDYNDMKRRADGWADVWSLLCDLNGSGWAAKFGLYSALFGGSKCALDRIRQYHEAESKLDNARRELALMVGVLDGTITVPEHRSDGVEKARRVMERVAVAEKALAEVLAYVNRRDGDDVPKQSERTAVGIVDKVYILEKRCEKAEQERDSLRARVAELEKEVNTERETYDVRNESSVNLYHYACNCAHDGLPMSGVDIFTREEIKRLRARLREIEDNPVTLESFTRFLRSQYPDAEVILVHVVGNALSILPTTKDFLDMTHKALESMDALAGKEET